MDAPEMMLPQPAGASQDQVFLESPEIKAADHGNESANSLRRFSNHRQIAQFDDVTASSVPQRAPRPHLHVTSEVATKNCDSQFADPHHETQFAARTPILSYPLSAAVIAAAACGCAALEGFGVFRGHEPYKGTGSRQGLKLAAAVIFLLVAVVLTTLFLLPRRITSRIRPPVLAGRPLPRHVADLTRRAVVLTCAVCIGWPLGVALAAFGMEFFGECCFDVYPAEEHVYCRRFVPGLPVIAVLVPLVVVRIRTRFVLPGYFAMSAACIYSAVAESLRHSEGSERPTGVLVAMGLGIMSVFCAAVGIQIVQDSYYRKQYSNECRCVGAEIDLARDRDLTHRMLALAVPEHLEHAASLAPSLSKFRESAMATAAPCAVGLFDIFRFAAWAQRLQPLESLLVLQSLWWAFDNGCCERRVTKVGSFGDRYMVTAGLCDAVVDFADAVASYVRWQRQTAYQSIEHTLVGLLGDTEVGDAKADRYFGAVDALQIRAASATGEAHFLIAGARQQRVCITGTAVAAAERALVAIGPSLPPAEAMYAVKRSNSVASMHSHAPGGGSAVASHLGSGASVTVDAARGNPLEGPSSTPTHSDRVSSAVQWTPTGTGATAAGFLPPQGLVHSEILPRGVAWSGADIDDRSAPPSSSGSGAGDAAARIGTAAAAAAAADAADALAVPTFVEMKSKEDAGFGRLALLPLGCHYAFLAAGLAFEIVQDDTYYVRGNLVTLSVLGGACLITVGRGVLPVCTQIQFHGVVELIVASLVGTATTLCCLFRTSFYSMSVSYIVLVQLLLLPSNLKRNHPLVVCVALLLCLCVPHAFVICWAAESLGGWETWVLIGREVLASFFLLRSVFFKANIDRMRYAAAVAQVHALESVSQNLAAQDTLLAACVPSDVAPVLLSKLQREADAPSTPASAFVDRTDSAALSSRIFRRLDAIGLPRELIFPMECTTVCAMNVAPMDFATPAQQTVLRDTVASSVEELGAGGLSLVSMHGDRCLIAGPFRRQDCIRDFENCVAAAIACVRVVANISEACAGTAVVTAACAVGDATGCMLGFRGRRFDMVGPAVGYATALLLSLPSHPCAFATEAFARTVCHRDLSCALDPAERPNLTDPGVADPARSAVFAAAVPWATTRGFRGPVFRLRLEAMISGSGGAGVATPREHFASMSAHADPAAAPGDGAVAPGDGAVAPGDGAVAAAATDPGACTPASSPSCSWSAEEDHPDAPVDQHLADADAPSRLGDEPQA